MFILLHIFLLTPVQRRPGNIFARVFIQEAVQSSPEVIVDFQPVESLSGNPTHITKRGGLHVYTLKVARLLICLTLLALSILSAIVDERRQSDGLAVGALGEWEKVRKHAERPNHLLSKELLDLAMCVTYVGIHRKVLNYLLNSYLNSSMLLYWL